MRILGREPPSTKQGRTLNESEAGDETDAVGTDPGTRAAIDEADTNPGVGGAIGEVDADIAESEGFWSRELDRRDG